MNSMVYLFKHVTQYFRRRANFVHHATPSGCLIIHRSSRLATPVVHPHTRLLHIHMLQSSLRSHSQHHGDIGERMPSIGTVG